MELKLSWDVVFMVLFLVIFGVAFIRPHKFTLRLLLGTYLALLIAEGGALFLEKIIIPIAPELQIWVSEHNVLFFMIVRLLLFFVSLLLFLSRAHYHIEHKHHDHWFVRSTIHFFFAALIGILISTSVFALLSGNSIIEAALAGFAPNAWFDSSKLVEPFLHFFGIWIVLPAMGMLLVSILHPKGDV
jgi:hypothetical protein